MRTEVEVMKKARKRMNERMRKTVRYAHISPTTYTVQQHIY